MFDWSLKAIGEHGFAYNGPAAAVTERCIVGKQVDWFLFLPDLKLILTVFLNDLGNNTGFPAGYLRVGL